MFTHVMVGSNDMDRAQAFYAAVLSALGYEMRELAGRVFFVGDHGVFAVGRPINGAPATFANGGTIGFAAKTNDQVDAFYAAGLASGGACEGPPGPRQNARGFAYAAYLRDPDGNKICAICGMRVNVQVDKQSP
jgi:catechol 2,3-dioxygenase-like lactoylglutathione lyase family enzyme